MAGRINDDDVKAVRDAVPIDAVVSEYLQLRNAGGGNLKGLCPFHDEKSPSFQVSPAKGLFYCFGCQEGGDTVDFIMKIDHLSFAETIERLASQAGITLRYEEGGYTPGRQQGERIRLVEAHKIAARFYADQLSSPEAEIGRKFLAGRGFDQAAAEHFGVGYSPAGWDHLTRFLRGKGFSDKELLLSGLAQDSRSGKPIDRFRGRLMWPIRDITGEVIGFGARKLRDDDNGPKYLNTPETAIYKKSHVLYGIDLAKKDIAKSNRAVVVEGYTDVMACHLAGVTTAIATCGTAFAGDHIKILRRLLMDNAASEVVFTFDGDAAGQKAALRAFEDDQKFAAETSIAITPGGMDPCDLRLAEGDAAVAALVESRTPLFAFAIRQVVARHNLDTAEGRAAALEAAAPIVANIKNSAIQHEYAVQLAGMLGILDSQFVVRRVGQLARWARERGQRPDQARSPQRTAPATAQAAPQARPGPALNLRSPAQLTERELLKLALQHPALVAPAFDAYGEDEFTAAPYVLVRRAIEQAGGVTQAVTQADAGYLAKVRDAAPDDTVRSLVTELAVEAVRAKTVDEAYAGVQLVQVRLRAVERRVQDVQASMVRLGSQADPDHLAAVANELWVLEQYGRALKDRGAAAL
ncbi:DNA primase [Streptomyces triculaminicus]|uniref:DNA primase n=2 Tax=Streptomyces TaxID=1883 RepID=A0A939FVJ8_9ACTN|nr:MULTISPECIES: DNA primase [Streptomyces]MBO0656860.1 DNA primase [Streptomyces triculaminicus]QSY47716.1 DNA primase [Streptomyces griseocarneus]